MLTQIRLKEIIHYDAETGIVTWLVPTSNRVRAGSSAGTWGKKDGYLHMSVDGGRYLAHRLVWLYMTGSWPSFEIDHRNTNRSDNRWRNLRDLPRPRNAENQRKARIDNSTGFLGVRKMRRKFQANIRVNGRSRNCGIYSTPESAHAAYVEAKRKFHAGCTL